MRDPWERLSQPPYYITAYEYALRAGYTGTEEEFGDGLAASARAREAAEEAEAAAGEARTAAQTAQGVAAGAALLAQQAKADADAARQDALSAAADAVASLTDLSADVVTEWLEENITSPSSPPVDTSMSVAGAAADAAMVGRMIDTDGYIFPAIEQGSLGMDNGVITKYTNAKRLRLSSTLSNGIFEISCDSGYFYLLWVTGASAGYDTRTVPGPCTVSFDDDNTFSISMGRDDGGDISVPEGRHLHIRRVEDFGTPEKVKYGSLIRLADKNMPEANYGLASSEVFKIPEGGFSVSAPFEIDDANKKFWRATFYKMVDGRLETNPDYSYGYMVTPDDPEDPEYGCAPRTNRTTMTVFYPYEAGVYAQISAKDPGATAITLYDRREGGRPLTLAPMAIRSVVGAVTKPLRYQPSFKVYASGAYTTPQSIYGTIIRLEDADGICCSPYYALSAWFYDGTVDEVTGQLVPVDAVYSTPSPSVAVGGPTFIDFRGRNAIFAIVGIRCAVWSAGETVAERDTATMGILAREDDVLDNVHVMWRQHVTITHRNEMPLVLAENIHWLKTHTLDIMEHHYRGPWTKNQTVFHAANATLGFYAGNNYANSLLSMVTLDNYAAALKHRYSRGYVGEWYPYRVDPLTQTVKKPDEVTGSGYGWICANLPAALCGFRWFATAMNFFKIPNYNGFEIIKDIDLRTDIDQLRAGDWLWGQDMEINSEGGQEVYRYDYHVMITTDVIYVNGAPYAAEFLEVYPPMVRRRFLCFDPLLAQITEDFGSEADFTYYNLIARPNPRDLRRIEDVWDTDISAYTPGKVAVDRGHNGVYCSGNKYIYVTVYDDSVTDILLVKDGEKDYPITINIEAWRAEDAGKRWDKQRVINLYGSQYDTVNIIDSVGPGWYDVYVNGDNLAGDPQDSFLVADVPDIAITWPPDNPGTEMAQEVVINTKCPQRADGKVIDPVTGYEILCLIGNYKPSVDGEYPTPSGSEDVEYVYNPDTGEWEYVIVPGGGVSPTDDPMAQDLRFSLSIRAEDLTGDIRTARFPYTTRFKVGDFEADFFFNWVDIMYATPNGGIVMGQDRTQRWCNSDGKIQKADDLPT